MDTTIAVATRQDAERGRRGVVRAVPPDVYWLETVVDDAARTGGTLELVVEPATDRHELGQVAALCRQVVRRVDIRLRLVDADAADPPGDERRIDMSSIEKSVDVHAPVDLVYRHWKRIPTFPWFMKGVMDVEPLDEHRSRWCARIAGIERSWEAAVCEEIPNARIAWHSTDGAQHAGVVTFHRLADHDTRVMVQLEYEPESVVERVGDLLGAPAMRIEGDLERFKEWVEDGPSSAIIEALGA